MAAHPGGGPFNTARAVARLEQPVAFLGRLSRDRFGRELERLLRADGVTLDATRRSDEPTTLAVAEVDEHGAASYGFYTQGTASAGLTPKDALETLPAGVEVLQVGTLGLALEPTARALEAVVERLAGSALVAVDPNVRAGAIPDEAAYRARLERICGAADLLKVSEDDLAWLDPGRPWLQAARALLDAGPAAVVVTRGAQGSAALTKAGTSEVEAAPVEVVDTIGAGDAFGGGFLAWWRANGLGRDALGDHERVVAGARYASLVAALPCGKPGASPPRLDEVRGS